VKTLKVFFAGEKVTDSKTYLEKCIDKYNKALSNVGTIHLIAKVSEIEKGKK
jgi:hypothetical protein